MRCDVTQLPLQSQHRDPAVAAYNGMQMVDMQHNHPIKWAFSHLLIAHMKARQRRANQQGGTHRHPAESVRHRIVRNRWHLALMLATNPTLRSARRHGAFYVVCTPCEWHPHPPADWLLSPLQLWCWRR